MERRYYFSPSKVTTLGNSEKLAICGVTTVVTSGQEVAENISWQKLSSYPGAGKATAIIETGYVPLSKLF